MYFYPCDKIDFERVKDYADIESDDEIPQLKKKELVKLKNTINITDDTKEDRKCSCTAETTCPTCFEMYPFDQIEAHANICADNYLDRIGHVSDDNLEELLNDPPEISSIVGEHENASSEAKIEKIKQIVAELSKNVYPVTGPLYKSVQMLKLFSALYIVV